MSWLSSLVVAVLTGVLGMVLSGVVANMAVGWYRVSSFEGGAGYFVIGIALLGLVGGAIVGLVTARMMASTAPSFLKVLAVSGGIVTALVAGGGGISRLVADVPPTVDGEGLFLAFELRWPERETRAPADFPGAGYARLGAGTSAHVVRAWGDGVLFVDDARQEDGRWVVPGFADIFTARGDRILDIGIGDSALAGFIVNLPAHPGAEFGEWSEWLPRAKPGAPPLPDQFSYRFRVVTAREPLRHQTVGPFEVSTVVSSLFQVANAPGMAARSSFGVTYRGAPVSGVDSADAVAVVPGDPPAVLALSGDPQLGEARCLLISGGDAGAEVKELSGCAGGLAGDLLTADAATWHAAHDVVVLPGWLDRTTFRQPGLYLLGAGILDTDARTFTAVEFPSEPTPINGLPPVSLSPDRRSFVWFTHDGTESKPVLCVTNWQDNTTYIVPIDRARMRYSEYKAIDPAWVAYHFTWGRAEGGADRLIPRENFTPLPYRGEREVDRDGNVTAYYLRPGGTELRNAMVDVMVRELGGERMPDELDGYHRVVRFGDRLVKAAYVEGGGFVSISMDFGKGDPALIARLADQLDAVIATRRYDALFHLD